MTRIGQAVYNFVREKSSGGVRLQSKLFSSELEVVRDELFLETTKVTIASNIFAACQMSKDLRDSMINLPKRASWFAGHALPYFIDRLLSVQIDNSVLGRFPYNYREVRIPKCGHPYVEYYSEIGKFHIKKVSKAGKLPDSAIHRRSNATSNQCLLNLGPEFTPGGVNVPFSLITYGHTRFNLDFIYLGFPKWDYTEWADNWDISNAVSREVAEDIRTGKGPALKEEYQEKIIRTFNLTFKG